MSDSEPVMKQDEQERTRLYAHIDELRAEIARLKTERDTALRQRDEFCGMLDLMQQEHAREIEQYQQAPIARKAGGCTTPPTQEPDSE